jgi:hypothetical protein
MRTSREFRKAMLFDQSPSAADNFEQRVTSLFISDSLKSWIDVHAEDATHGRSNGRNAETPGHPRASVALSVTLETDDPDRLSVSVSGLKTGSESEGDDVSPSRFVGPGLALQKVSDESQLRQLISVCSSSLSCKIADHDVEDQIIESYFVCHPSHITLYLCLWG